jgi:hypothetical protein
MFPNWRLQSMCWLCAGAGLLLAACQAAPAPLPTATSLIAATCAPTVGAATASPTAALTDTPASTATTAPSDTPASPTPQPASSTPSSTSTNAPTATASPTAPPTARPTSLPTRVPVTITPLGPPSTNSIYSTTGGPAGYSSTIQCQRAVGDCAPVMPPGDISFRLTLAGDPSAPWTHFINYGLAVEKDGANVASLFMFVDAGWLQPGTVVGFGASRTFSQPGIYVIRSSGCLTTDIKSNGCGWATIAGDVVTFQIR